MKSVILACLALALAFPARGNCADARDVTELLSVAWESFWQQSGYPRNVFKWREPIRVKLSGDTAGRHREFALREMERKLQPRQIAEAMARAAAWQQEKS